MTDPTQDRAARFTCPHFDVWGGVGPCYCSLCVAETMHTLGCDEVTAKFAIALHQGYTKGCCDA